MQVHKIRLMFDISENGGLLRSNDAINLTQLLDIFENVGLLRGYDTYNN